MKDEDIYNMFQASKRFEDASDFESRVLKSISFRGVLRQALIAVSGFIGGLYALGQFFNLSHLKLYAPEKHTSDITSALISTELSLTNGAMFRDSLDLWLSRTIQVSADYLQLMQSPLFFWISFSLCMTIVGLYLANSEPDVL
jgi:hypothetical protein